MLLASNACTACGRLQAVVDGVFQQRLQHQRWHLDAPPGIVGIDVPVQPVFHACAQPLQATRLPARSRAQARKPSTVKPTARAAQDCMAQEQCSQDGRIVGPALNQQRLA
jgi:hypothetical protein